MADVTPNIGLKKPLENESADIAVINVNMEKIDQTLGSMSSVPTTAKDTAGAIAELHNEIEARGDSSSVATPNTLVKRDAQGRGKVVAPAADDDIARKDTVDSAVAASTATLDAKISTKADITYVNSRTADATTAVKGIVQLNNTTNSTSTTHAATASAVKIAYDAAILARTYAP